MYKRQLLNLHLSFNTIKDFKYVPTKKTSKLFWTYLRSNNLLDSTSDIDTADEEKISLLEKATHERNYNEKDLLNIYKKFQFSVDQLLNIEREKEDLSNLRAFGTLSKASVPRTRSEGGVALSSYSDTDKR